MLKKQVIYPVFLECCQYCEYDPFWLNIFEELSFGNPPYGSFFSFSNNRRNIFLCSTYKQKEFSYKIERNNPKLLYTEIRNLISKKLNMYSEIEKKEINSFIENNKISSESWNDIKKKSIRNIFIDQFVLENKKQFNLTIDKARKLRSKLLAHIVLKTINSSNIKFKKNRIISIDGVSFKDKCVFFDDSIFKLETSNIEKSYEFSEKQKMSSHWKKYTKDNSVT